MHIQDPPPHPQASSAVAGDRALRHPRPQGAAASAAPASPRVRYLTPALAERTPGASAADADADPDRSTATARRPPPGVLDLSIRRRGGVIELGLVGDLDMATAPRLGEAMAWLRVSRGPAPTIVIDTTDLDFVAAAGYHALQSVLVRPDGLWDPRVVLVVGPALARREAAISASSTARTRRSEAAGRGASSDSHGPSGHRRPRSLAR